jgi:hypothetical protein
MEEERGRARKIKAETKHTYHTTSGSVSLLPPAAGILSQTECGMKESEALRYITG